MRSAELKRPTHGWVVVVGVVAHRLMKQTRRNVMENTAQEQFAGLDRGSGHQVNPPSLAFGTRLVEGFETILAAEDDSKGPVAMFCTAANGVAYPEEV